MTRRKSTATPRQITALAEQRKHGQMLREWHEGRIREAEKAARKPVEHRPGGHGITRLMNNIIVPDPEPFHMHDFAAGWDRRHFRTSEGAVAHLHPVSRPARRYRDDEGEWKVSRRSREDSRLPALNAPYRKDLEDLEDNPKASRRLRPELRR